MKLNDWIFLMMLSRTGYVAAMIVPRTGMKIATTTSMASTRTTPALFQYPRSSPSRRTRLFYSNPMSASSSFSDNSAITQSRPPFRMPRDSPDDSKTQGKTASNSNVDGTDNLNWNPLGLWTELVNALERDLHLAAPTPIQSMVIPELLSTTSSGVNDDEKGETNAKKNDSLAFLAATGSGKTLAYLLPLVQQLKHEETFENYERRPRRPRIIILAPTRELVRQITTVCKSLSHAVKISSLALVGGGKELGTQRKALSREVDVIVATPGRLLQHWKQGNVFLGSVNSIVLDEMDTMLEQGFQRELRELLYPLLYPSGKPPPPSKNTGKKDTLILKENAPRIVLTSATMTQAVQKLIGDNPKTSKLSVAAKKAFVKRSSGMHGDAGTANVNSKETPKLQLPKMKILYAPGLHKAVPRLEQIFVDVGSTDKISLLLDVVSSESYKKQNRKGATIIFCNTSASCRAVQFALAEARIESLSYHGELNSDERSDNLKKFRQAAAYSNDDCDDELPTILVCTDLAARGLDIPEVDHVIMFDFPLNALDYLHRSGRTARGEGRGKVTALVTKRDKVLATAIEQAVRKGQPLDGLSSRKSDYLPGARFGAQPKKKSQQRRRQRRSGGNNSRRK